MTLDTMNKVETAAEDETRTEMEKEHIGFVLHTVNVSIIRHLDKLSLSLFT